MSAVPSHPEFTARDHEDLARAVASLERTSFAIKIADVVGKPVTRIVGRLPDVAARLLMRAIESAIFKCLTVAIDSLEGTPPITPSRWVPRITTGLTGGIGGLFGALALPIELPLTTAFMLQSIADIARHQGEDLARLEARLACLEVFALGDRRAGGRADIGYYATRSLLAQLAREIIAHVLQRGTVDSTSPVIARMVGELASRFGITVSELAAASVLPIVGAVSGAAVNVAFMSHFQQIAEGHFTVRRLERRYGSSTVRKAYQSLQPPKSAPSSRDCGSSLSYRPY